MLDKSRPPSSYKVAHGEIKLLVKLAHVAGLGSRGELRYHHDENWFFSLCGFFLLLMATEQGEIESMLLLL